MPLQSRMALRNICACPTPTKCASTPLILSCHLLQSMSMHAGTAKAAGVQRQGCMALRNICARSPELRPAALAAGGEAAARTAKAR